MYLWKQDSKPFSLSEICLGFYRLRLFLRQTVADVTQGMLLDQAPWGALTDPNQTWTGAHATRSLHF